MTTILAIDPGEVHCGMAYFEDDNESWHLVSSWELEPNDCEWTAFRMITEENLDTLIVEEFRLYPWKSEQQAFNQIRTVEVIGVLRFLYGRAVELGHECKWKEQGASIKKPTAAIINAKGIKAMKGSNRHMKDAQLHGWYHILHDLEGEAIE